MISDGELAWIELPDGREMIASTRGTTVCTLVEMGSSVAMGRFSGWIYYVRDRVLWRVPLRGGRAQRLRQVAFQPARIGIDDGLLMGWDHDRRWEVMIGDSSPSAEERRGGTTCDP